jgi:hypothetical protein
MMTFSLVNSVISYFLTLPSLHNVYRPPNYTVSETLRGAMTSDKLGTV